ncbi:uncharacterized protein VTP21DRAFT_5358 [Calcarisporiella thermophila]|uniref:uncharacterized protein n=1 Tax=Calcarisporiella thermophila TaxID=911321 RepID=UPI003742C2BE
MIRVLAVSLARHYAARPLALGLPGARAPVRLLATGATQAPEFPREFTVLEDPRVHDKSLPSFMVGTQNGFLPRQDPLVELPSRFGELEQLLNDMPVSKRNGQPGLLAQGKFGDAALKLPEYDVRDVIDNQVLSALYRDYTFAASAYLLEPCDLRYRATRDYGIGRQILPRNIAVPLSIVAQKIQAKPFMEYALSYCLFNYKRKDPKGDLSYSNLECIRSFEGSASESGFILCHVAMVAHSGPLVKESMRTLEAAEHRDRVAFNTGLRNVLNTYRIINREMEEMWKRSAPDEYLRFRTFIMGTKSQPMFPHGVIYEGVSDEPTFFRGESGANDSMVPLGDNLLELTLRMPENPLTQVLRDFRSYRPTNHREFLEHVQQRASKAGVRRFAEEDPESTALYLANVDQIRDFRHRHWQFTKKYILEHTEHPRATGGSPIVTWLPNQLSTVLRVMEEVSANINTSTLSPELKGLVEEIGKRAVAQRRVLEREVSELRKIFKDQDRADLI